MKRIRKFFTTFVAVIVLSLSMTLSGCGFGGAKTDDEIYSALANATREMFDYNKSITLKMDYVIYENDKECENAKIVYSINPKEDKMFCSVNSKEADIVAKVFKENGESYIMSSIKAKQSASGGTLSYENKEYHALTGDGVRYFTSLNSFVIFTEQDLDVLFKDYVYSFEETKMAFKSVFAAQLTDRRSADEYAEAQYNITTQKDINSISLEDYSQIKMKEKTTSRGFGVYTVTNRSKIVGKNGKIAQLKNEGELCFSPLSSNYSSEKEKRVISIDINYSFDSSGYNKIETDLPEVVDAYPYAEDFKMKFNVGGMITEKTTTAYAFDSQVIFDGLTKDFRNGGCKIDWFLDSNYTQPFVSREYSYEQLRKIECIYGRVSVNDGYAIVARDYRVEDARSDFYKIVFGPVFESSLDYEVFKRKVVAEESTYSLPLMDDNIITSINGQQLDGNSRTFNLDSGKLYLVEHTEILKDSDFSIFDVDVSSLWHFGDRLINTRFI